ncbi:HalOD1 output domain-containing protein [Halorussus salinisoli]|uniref:HalOD1 output domain-containing protein n=1 Tax=Halorussus salinisoli TaxID=2558242 RepID=UPI0010C1C1DB|nr:HalOD1 output domain-containing protein [Halorussus salinisoli]
MSVSRTALSDDQNVSTTIVAAVADAEGISPTEVNPPLHSAIDPEALNDLFGSPWSASESGPRVSFTYSGYDVTVSGDGNVVVRRASDSEPEQTI